MPFITAREDAGLSLTINSQDIDAIVFGGQRLAVDWVQRQDNDNGLSQIRLAGNYTCPETHRVLRVGDLRFINSTRFDIPQGAWIEVSLPRTHTESKRTASAAVAASFITTPINAGSAMVSAEQCQKIFGRTVTNRQLADLNACLQCFEINTPARIAHFMAQIAHESGGLQWLQEIADGRAYERRTDLGNTQAGDGPRFKGAGALQLTGRYNYQAFSDFINDQNVMEGCDYVANNYPFSSAGFWWQNNSMNKQVDAGASCRAISSRVNGRDPANGLADREAYYAKAVAVIGSQVHASPRINEESRTAANESVRSAYDPNAPVDWQNPKCKVSRFFTVAEVTNSDPQRIPQRGSEVEANILRLAKELDKVREAWGSPIGVTSWYRPQHVNAAVRGVSNSQHIPGLAADIYTMDATDQWHPRNREFEKWLDETAWCDRALGYGCAANKGFTHVDMRPGRIRWDY